MPIARTLLLLASCLTALTAMADLFAQVEHHYTENDGVKLHYVSMGSTDDPCVVMIHGFPDFWYTWRKQMPVLAAEHRVVAVDLRGYNESGKPKGVENYAMPILVDDIVAVIAAEQRSEVIVAGHDWGGAIAWAVAMNRPDLVSHLVIFNLPHPKGLSRELKNSEEQQRSSQYAYNFQQPGAHTFFTAEGLAQVSGDEAARPHYLEAFKKSDFEAMLNYYKANYPKPGDGFFPEYPQVQAPVLMFHGLRDRALLPGALAGTWNWVSKDLTLVTYPHADHWVQRDAAEQINGTLVDWLRRQHASTPN